MLPLDLHVLSLSLAFILSQDQTLHCYFCFVIILLCDSLDVLVLFIGSTLFRVLFRSGRLLKRSILPRIRSHALIPCYQEIRGVHYTICYISSFSKISLSRPISRNPDPLGAEPRSGSERDCKDTKTILTPAILRGKFLSSSTQPRPVLRKLARPLPSFAFAKVTLLFYSNQIYFLPSRVNNCCITTNQQLTKEIFLQQRG